jgi:hypothetical protein
MKNIGILPEKAHKSGKINVLMMLIFIAYAGACAQSSSIILGRPTDTSVTVSILFSQNTEYYFEYGTAPGVYTDSSPHYMCTANIPDEPDIAGLTPGTRYFYRVYHRGSGAQNFTQSPEYTFHTQRPPGSPFSFTLEADEHLYDKKGAESLYRITLDNQASDQPDFMLSLGDIFGDDHNPFTITSGEVDALHKDYRPLLGRICHSIPFYLCLGNHEGENDYYLAQTPPENLAVWATQWRKYYYPNPYPNEFYSGNTTLEPYGIETPENYYAWTWGDALFVVLDVYRDQCDTSAKPKNWDWSLGLPQYTWLKNTLENSTSKYKFVFAHHTRGQGRGAVETAMGFEWGGYDNGKWKFDTYRPGWAMPIHQLMVDNGVNIFFQGHDHLFAVEQLDGLTYQEVPMPSDSTYEIGVLANADAYTDVTLEGSGHLRVMVSPTCVTVDYIRAYLPADTLGGVHRNREVAYSYTIGECSTTAVHKQEDEEKYSVYPNPASDMVWIQALYASVTDRPIELVNINGARILSTVLKNGSTSARLDLKGIAPGFYLAKILDGATPKMYKIVVSR